MATPSKLQEGFIGKGAIGSLIAKEVLVLRGQVEVLFELVKGERRREGPSAPLPGSNGDEIKLGGKGPAPPVGPGGVDVIRALGEINRTLGDIQIAIGNSMSQGTETETEGARLVG